MRKIVRGFFASYWMGIDGRIKQWPIWYRMKETGETIVLKRAVSNLVYHSLFKLLLIILLLTLLILSVLAKPQPMYGILQWIAIILIAWNVFRLVGLFRFRLVIQKDRKIMIKREYRTIKLIVNGVPFKVRLRNDTMFGYYDGVPMFVIDCETEEYKVLLDFFKLVNTPIER